MYTPKETAIIRTIFETLVLEKRISIEIDGYGNPVQHYTREAMETLSNAIKRLPSFPRKCVVENAMLETSTDYSGEIFAAICGEIPMEQVRVCVFENVARLVNEAAFLETSESLFTTAQIQDMLRQHPDYEYIAQRAIREGKLLRDEMDEMRKAS
jgi:hypothetical protein